MNDQTEHNENKPAVEQSALIDGLSADKKKVIHGSDYHLTLLMAKYNLNFVTGSDRQDLLAWGRDVWNSAKADNK